MARKMYLKALYGKWALKDDSNIFGNIVYIDTEEDMNKYHLVDSNLNDIQVGHVSNYLIYDYYMKLI